MAFFKKLKDRLFKSSSKIEEGLDAIVEDGGVEEDAVQEDAAQAEAAQAEAEAEQREASRLEAERAEAQAKAEADAMLAEEKLAADLARIAAEKEAAEAEALAQAAARQRQDAANAKVEADRAAADKALREETARQAQIEARFAKEKAEAETAEREAQRRAAQEAAERAAQDRAQAARVAEEARKAEADRQAEAAQQAEAAAKPGLLGRLLGRGDQKTVVRREVDDDMLEQLEELLISADMGVDTALRVTANMAEGRFGKRLSTQEIKDLLAAEVTRIMDPVARPMPLYPSTPQVVLVVGVNGSGKTTTIGKLASQFQAAGKKVVIAAGDTFRAAAVEQLQVWGDRAGVPVLTAPEGSDPASLAFDAMEQAARDGADLLMIDTAGRLQNRADLMEELSKIVRVIRKKDPDAPHNTLLVLDATTGQNALSQVKTFQELADVTGLVMTKLDGTAKGGVLVALADKFGLPIHAIGVGEQIDDLAPFDPEEFAAALIGTDR
ncbi:signal recognition particle-docking protein FtsY [Pseudooctadecabacter sp.]|uniref:signal recognition particle-docking protein FtsY n=1 Tax=Pseudooctadecabacter sp. TaxID=1966338 RepID=UPI0025EC5D9E|nr:signal recognition particle-docking protein FtsY [Pseudooctadecabacter sp.]